MARSRNVDRYPGGRARTALARGACAVALVAAQACAGSRPPQPPPAPLEGGRLAQAVETQKAVNRYLHDVVVPRLRPCWERLQATGAIEMRSTYVRGASGGWALDRIDAGRTGLPPDDAELALSCMREATPATAPPLGPDATDERYVLAWTWPVPLPPDAEQQYAAMLRDTGGTQGSGCDGHGAAAACVTCSGTDCLVVCVGGDPPCTITVNPVPGGFKTCTTGGRCASGGPFGVVGGFVAY